jgi:hypothetical protein
MVRMLPCGDHTAMCEILPYLLYLVQPVSLALTVIQIPSIALEADIMFATGLRQEH